MGWLGAEIAAPSDEFHREHFERDRRKDLAVAAANYLPLRVSARMVFYEWPTVEAAIERLLNSQGHTRQSTKRSRRVS